MKITLLLWFTAVASSAAPAIDGIWKLATPSAEPVTLRLKSAAKSFEGSYAYTPGEFPISETWCEGASVGFTLRVPFAAGAYVRRFDGTVTGDEMELRVTRPTHPNAKVKTQKYIRVSGDPGVYARAVPERVTVPLPLPWDRLAPLPPMGWNSWYAFDVKVDDASIRAMADAMASNGMLAAGYRYLNIDDGWQGTRDPEGNIRPNERFPDMRALSDYVHRKGFLLGIYSSPGPHTCAGFEGSFGHEEQDAKTYAAWGVDLLKYDWCSAGYVMPLSEMGWAYGKMGAALRATGRPIVFSICQYGMMNVAEWAPLTGAHMWRSTVDIKDRWNSMKAISTAQAGLERYARPGAWNDPDMLQASRGGMSAIEYRTQMTLWAMLAAPLLVSSDLRKIGAEDLAILTNPEVIAVNQDRAGKQGRVVASKGDVSAWVRPLASGGYAIAVVNLGDEEATAGFSLTELRVPSGLALRNLWGGAGELPTTLPPHASVMLRAGK